MKTALGRYAFHIERASCFKCCLWPWLGPALTTVQYVMYFRFVDNLIFHIMGQIQIGTQAWSLRRSELFTVTRQVAPLNSALGAKSAVAEGFSLFVVLCVKLVISQLFSDARQTFRIVSCGVIILLHSSESVRLRVTLCTSATSALVDYYFFRVHVGLLRTSMGACIT